MDKGKMVLFTISGCNYCNLLKLGLLGYGIEFEEVNISQNSILGDKLEETYKCKSYPMVLIKNSNVIWLPESSLLPSPNIGIYNNINELIENLKFV